MLVVIPVVAMLIGLGLLEGAALILTPAMALVALSALPGLEAVLFSRDMPRTGEMLVGAKQHSHWQRLVLFRGVSRTFVRFKSNFFQLSCRFKYTNIQTENISI